MGFSYEYPYFFIIFFIFIACHIWCPIRHQSFYFPHLSIFKSQKFRSSFWLVFLKMLSIFLIIVALASPYKETTLQSEPKNGYDIALILDVSPSMNALGLSKKNYRKNRFAIVQEIVDDFIKKRKNDHLGVVVFGAYAFVASPLTFDKNILSAIVKRLYIKMAGNETAIIDALAQGVALFNKSKSKSKIAILLTDGQNTSGDIPLSVAIKLAKKNDVKVYTIGIGRTGEFNELLLDDISQKTGGKSYSVYSKSQLEKVYKQIDSLEKSEIIDNKFTYKEYFYIYPLFIGFLLLILYILLQRKGF